MRQVAFVLSAVLALASPAHALTEPRGTLVGRVVNDAGKPLTGAKVHVYTAAPRDGVGAICPSCYPECAKSAFTDRQGRFVIPRVSTELVYRLLVVAPGRDPEFVTRVDPLAAPVSCSLRARDTVLAAGLRALRGRVLDPEGGPVVGATILPVGIQTGGDRTMFGDPHAMNARVDAVAVSDAEGAFRLVAPDSVESWVLQVAARGLAPHTFPDTPVGAESVELRLERGATVTGVLRREGEPVPHAVLAVTQLDQNAFNAVRPDTISTDEQGRFTFANVPANQDHAFAGILGTMGPWALRTIVRTVGENDSVTTLPPFQVERGHRLSGRVRLSDGRPAPPETKVLVSRALVGGAVGGGLVVDSTGAFSLDGLPEETIELRVYLKGYRLSTTTRGYAGRMMGAVRIPMLRDRDDVEIVLEPAAARSAKP